MAHEWADAFLWALSESPNVTAAAEAAGITRDAAYKYRDINPEFASAWQSAIDRSTDNLVGEAYRRAYAGTEEPVYQGGERVGAIRRYSDALTMFLLKTHRREVYGDKMDVTTAGKSLSTGPAVLAILTDNDLNSLESIAERLALGPPSPEANGEGGKVPSEPR